MKNWFLMMAATMVAAMKSYFKRGGSMQRSGTMRRGSVGPVGRRNPAGSKVLRAAYKAAQGQRGTYDQSAKWYRNLADGRYKAGHQRSITGQPLKF